METEAQAQDVGTSDKTETTTEEHPFTHDENEGFLRRLQETRER